MSSPKPFLFANSIFSTVTGLILIIESATLVVFFNVADPIVFKVIGFGLLEFAAFVLFTALKKSNNIKWVLPITIADFIWVAASMIIVYYNPFEISKGGITWIAVVAIVVSIFGFGQMFNLKMQKKVTPHL